MDWSAVASGAGAASGLMSAIINAGAGLWATKRTNETNQNIASQNILFQQKTNELNERLMREGWARDDTARQRMVADLENAGLSKWLAAGASPMTSSPITLESPHNDYKANYGGYADAISKSADAMSHLYSNFLQYEQTRKQNEILETQGEIAQEDLAIKEAEKIIKEHDATVFANRPDVASTDPTALKYLSEAINTLKGTNNAGKSARDFISDLKENIANNKKAVTKEKVEKPSPMFQLYKFMESKMRPAETEMKPLTMGEWRDLNGYTTLDQEKVKQYHRYVENWKKQYHK